MLPGDFQPPERSKRNILLFATIGIAGLGGLVATIAIAAFVISAWLGLPLAVFGLNDGPEQPIAFPHTVNVHDLGADCSFCHRTVTTEAVASIPSEGLCMTCHRVVGDDLPGVERLREISASRRPIDWIRVHRVPDHVRFVHEAHIRAFSGAKTVVERVDPAARETQIGVVEARVVNAAVTVGAAIEAAPSGTCVICHGNVGAMVKVKQVRSLKMGDCVECHRANSAPADWTTCHYQCRWENMAVTRRRFLSIAGGSAAGAVLFQACGVPEDELLVQAPLEMPEDLVEGFDIRYATLCRQCPTSEGIVVRVMGGRAKKVEGNVDYPINQGKHSARCEAAL